MKLARIPALLVFMGMLIFLPNAQAAFLSVSPVGSFDAVAAGATSITYDVFFNVEGGESFTFGSWDFVMQYDTAELDNWATSYLLAGTISEVTLGSLNNLFFSLTPATDVTFGSAGAYLLTSLTFDILAPVQFFDGIADFSVLSQIGDLFTGFTTAQGDFYQYDGAAGADVGTVPIPGAVWLLGSGILGLLGLNRGRRSR
ncbi:MAG: hypothetical protein HY788_20270 [Deltaproteobacteria bacterium]|nr:hypothetical protein [Deltaproteobacteria bacterium]